MESTTNVAASPKYQVADMPLQAQIGMLLVEMIVVSALAGIGCYAPEALSHALTDWRTFVNSLMIGWMLILCLAFVTRYSPWTGLATRCLSHLLFRAWLCILLFLLAFATICAGEWKGILVVVAAILLGREFWRWLNTPLRRHLAPMVQSAITDDLRAFAGRFGENEIDLANPDAFYVRNFGPLSYRFDGRALFAMDERLMGVLTPPELRAVFAHELAHHRLRHSFWTWMAGSAGRIAVLLLSVAAYWLLAAMAYGRVEKMAALTCVIREEYIIATGQVLLLMPLAIFLVWLVVRVAYLAYMRFQERQANRMALRMTGDSESFASAMCKLAEFLGGGPAKLSWLVRVLFSTHPSLEEVLEEATSHQPIANRLT